MSKLLDRYENKNASSKFPATLNKFQINQAKSQANVFNHSSLIETLLLLIGIRYVVRGKQITAY